MILFVNEIFMTVVTPGNTPPSSALIHTAPLRMPCQRSGSSMANTSYRSLLLCLQDVFQSIHISMLFYFYHNPTPHQQLSPSSTWFYHSFTIIPFHSIVWFCPLLLHIFQSIKKRFQKTNEITLFPRGRININIYAYATRVEAVAELLAIRPETRVTYYFQVGGSCSVRL